MQNFRQNQSIFFLKIQKIFVKIYFFFFINLKFFFLKCIKKFIYNLIFSFCYDFCCNFCLIFFFPLSKGGSFFKSRHGRVAAKVRRVADKDGRVFEIVGSRFGASFRGGEGGLRGGVEGERVGKRDLVDS